MTFTLYHICTNRATFGAMFKIREIVNYFVDLMCDFFVFLSFGLVFFLAFIIIFVLFKRFLLIDLLYCTKYIHFTAMIFSVLFLCSLPCNAHYYTDAYKNALSLF